NRLKKSEVNRNFVFSVMSKYLKTEKSSFHKRGPSKKLCGVQFRRSPMLVFRMVPSASRNGSLPLKSDPRGCSARCERSAGTSASNFVKSTFVACVGSKSPLKYNSWLCPKMFIFRRWLGSSFGFANMYPVTPIQFPLRQLPM